MNELLDSIKKHLGIRVAVNQLNHYTLLGITRDASMSEIKQALRSTAAAWNASDTKTDPDAARLVAKLIKQAQTDLLNATSKQEYDEQLSRRSLSTSQSFFPLANPFAPFDPEACLVTNSTKSSICSFPSAADRWDELRRQIPTLSAMSPTATTPPFPVASPQTPAAVRSESSVSKFERLKRQRKMKQALYVAGFLSVAAIFLGYAGIRFVLNRLEIAGKLETTKASPTTTLAKPKTTNARTIGGKNAPVSIGSDSAFVFPTLASSDASSESIAEATKPDAVSVPPLKPANDKSMIPVVSAASKAQWIEAMKIANDSVRRADFATFHKHMELALPLSSSDEMQAKHARLDQLGQLYEIFIKSVRDAKSKMRGSETLTVGKLRIAIVEIKDDELIVRRDGNNERFSWDRLPPGIAVAMADLTLSEQEPTDIAARAVYFSLSPARNELFDKKVSEWFEKSVGKGTIRKDLIQALSDTYE